MRIKNYLIIIIFSILLSSFVAIKNEYNKIQQKLAFVVENLENAKFAPIRVGWQFDYGFAFGGVLNKYEYIRSLFSYEDFQAMLDYPIYLSGPHTKNVLNLNSKYTFGHYNPRFVSVLRNDINEVLSNKYFVKYTRPIIEKYDFLTLLMRYKSVYNITINNPYKFKEIKSLYINGIKLQNWKEGDYRLILPEIIGTRPYWNWGETSYHFWIRRDIDNTKEIWIGLINDILNAYSYNKRINEKKNPEKYWNLGVESYKQKDYTNAILNFNYVIKLNPQFSTSYLLRGYCYQQTNNNTRALEDYNNYIQLEPDKYDGYSYRGSVKSELKDYYGAIADYKKAIEYNPKFSMAYNNIAWAKFEQKKYSEALIFANKAIELDRENYVAFDSRADIKFMLKDYNGCIKDANSALNLNSKLSNSYFIKARASYRLGNKQIACESWSKAGELGKVEAYEYISKYCNN